MPVLPCYEFSDAASDLSYSLDFCADHRVNSPPDFPDNVSAHDWDPYETYDQEQSRWDCSSSIRSFRTEEQEIAKATLSHGRSDTLSSLPVLVLPPPDEPQPLKRVRSLPVPPAIANAHAQIPVQCPTLPSVVGPPTLRIKVDEFPTFVLSPSDFDSTLDETRSVTSYAASLSSPEKVDGPFGNTKGSLSNPDLRGLGGREGFMRVDIIKTEDLPIYYPSLDTPTIGSPLSASTASFYSSSSSQTPVPSIRLSGESTVSRHRSNSENSLFTSPSTRSLKSVRPLPRPPKSHVIVPDRSRWVPPSAWDRQSKAVDLEELLSTDAGKKTSRPLSVLDFLKEDYAQQLAAIKPKEAPNPKLPRQPRQRRPGTAPDDKRPALTFDKSPLVALDQRVDIQNSVKFHRNTVPSQADIELASKLEVIAENGARVPFGSLFSDQKTVVFFLRHWWCPLDQQYMYSINTSVKVEMLEQKGLNLVVIGNGSFSMIKSYRKIFKSPYKVYTDPSMHVYSALGMTMRTTDGGPSNECGEYVKRGLVGGIAMVLKNAVKSRLPVWEKGGDIKQLGGEFVLGPGLRCSFAHRMHTTRSHSSVFSVLEAAGLPLREKVSVRRISLASSAAASVADEESWMAKRAKSLASLRSKKEQRRYGSHLAT